MDNFDVATEPVNGNATQDAMDTTTASSSVSTLKSEAAKSNGNGSFNGSSFFEGEESEDDEVFSEAVQRILELERRKQAVDTEESQLKSNLRERHEREKQSLNESSELLKTKEQLRDDLISLKEKRERLIDESDVLLQVDSEMRSFSKVTQSFNDALDSHLQTLNDKQAKIYTLKPMIQGETVAIECDLWKNYRRPLNEDIISAVQVNINHLQAQVLRNCDEYFIKRNDEFETLNKEESLVKQTIRSLKAKIREKQKKPATPKAVAKVGPASWKRAPSSSVADDSTTSDRNKRKKRTYDDDEESVANTEHSNDGGDGAGKRRGRRESRSKLDFTCEACQRFFADHDVYAYHVFRSCSAYEDLLQEKGLSIGDKEVACNHCAETYKSYAEIMEHKKIMHPEMDKNDGDNASSTTGRRPSGKRGKRN